MDCMQMRRNAGSAGGARTARSVAADTAERTARYGTTGKAAPSARSSLPGLATALAFFVLLTGCVSSAPFRLTDGKHQVQRSSLAVISGTSNKLDTLLAEALTRELQQRSVFKVLRWEEVMKQAPVAPYSIVRQAENPDTRDFYRSDGPPTDAIQKRTKTAYVLVVWVERILKETRTYYGTPMHSAYHARISGNLIEYPGGRIIGNTSFENVRSPSIFRSESEATSIDVLMKDSAQRIADDFLDATDSAKPGRAGRRRAIDET